MNPTPEPGPARRSWSIRDVMIVTAAVAVLMAGYRMEFEGHRGLGLVPACALLVAGLWIRDARAAWRAAGAGPGIFRVYIVAPACGVAAVVLADVVFLALSEMVRLWHIIRFAPPGLVPMAIALSLPLVLTTGPAILVARLWRRICWDLAIAPTAEGGTIATEDVKAETETIPEPVPVGPSG